MLEDIIFSSVIGAVIGGIGHIRRHGKIVLPRRTKKFIHLGFLEELLIGVVGSLIVVTYADLNSLVEVFFTSVFAGISGDVLLSSVKLLSNQNKE